MLIMFVKQKRGDATPSMVATLLEGMADGENRAEEEKLARNVAGVAYAGGADTVNELYS